MPTYLKEGETKTPEVEIAFSEKDVVDIHPYNDDPMIITVRYKEWEIRRVLVDKGSPTYILY